MPTFIAISAKNKTVDEIDFLRIHGVGRGTVIRSLEGETRVVVWNVSSDRTLNEQLVILEDAGMIAEQATDFAGVALLIEKFMP